MDLGWSMDEGRGIRDGRWGSSASEADGPAGGCGFDGSVDDFLSDAGDWEADGALEGAVFFEGVDEVFDGVSVGGSRCGSGHGVWARLSSGLEGDEVVVIVAGDSAFGAGDHESAARLRLNFPGVGEGSPPGLEFRETVGVASHDDGVFIDFQTGRSVDGGGDVDGASASLEPCAEGGSVSEVIEEGAAALVLFVEP